MEQEFQESYSEYTLKALLKEVGEEKKELYVEQAVSEIMKLTRWSCSQAEFLVYVGALEEASSYILHFRNDLDGNRYGSLLPIAEALDKSEFFLASAMVYRALINSTLERAKSKYYYHGVRYLKKIESRSEKVEDWKGLRSHSQYVEDIKKAHSRKRAFWSQL